MSHVLIITDETGGDTLQFRIGNNPTQAVRVDFGGYFMFISAEDKDALVRFLVDLPTPPSPLQGVCEDEAPFVQGVAAATVTCDLSAGHTGPHGSGQGVKRMTWEWKHDPF